MGGFLSLTGVAGVDSSSVERVLRELAVSKRGTMQPAQPQPGLLGITSSPEGHVTVLYPDNFYAWDQVSRHLSKELQAPALLLHIHDGDIWVYALYVDGSGVDWFNPIPDYWSDDISDDERRKWAGNAQVLARYWPRISAATVERYLVPWNDFSLTDKAYPSDNYGINDCWQMLDFMNKLGLQYPLTEQDEPLGATFDFQINQQELPPGEW